jgi:hypothetical protein
MPRPKKKEETTMLKLRVGLAVALLAWSACSDSDGDEKKGPVNCMQRCEAIAKNCQFDPADCSTTCSKMTEKELACMEKSNCDDAAYKDCLNASPDGGAQSDTGGASADQGAKSDTSKPAPDGVKCGDTTCAAGKICCDGDAPGSATCVDDSSKCASRWAECDGDEDCKSGWSCCMEGTKTQNFKCQPSSACPYPACRTGSDCPPGRSCCPLEWSAGLKSCFMGSCP